MNKKEKIFYVLIFFMFRNLPVSQK